MVRLVGPWSNNSSVSNSESVSILVGDGIVLSHISSDRSSSSIEEEPLLSAWFDGVSDSESVLVSTNMLMPEEGSSMSHA